MSKLALAVLFGLLALTATANNQFAQERYLRMREPRKYAFNGLN